MHGWKGNFIKINIVLRTRVQKCTYFKLLIDIKLGRYILKSYRVFVKNCQYTEKQLNKIPAII